MKKNVLLLLCIVALGIQSQAQKLGKFGADLGKKSIMGKEIRIPYTSLMSYYGYVGGDSKPDEEKGGKKYYYLYVWVPVAVPELGIRMVSPVPEADAPEAGDFKSPNYDKNASDKTSYFDTWIAFDKAAGIISSADIKAKAKGASWNTIDKNDDCSDLPANPGGHKYNSQIRMTSEISNPLKALTVGLYRIGFTTYKTGDVKGSFLAQIGTPIKVPGMVIASTLDELQTKISEKK